MFLKVNNFCSFNNKLILLRYKDKLLICTSTYEYLNSFKFLLKNFLFSKGLTISKKQEIYLSSSSFDSFHFLYWKFKKLQDQSIISEISNNAIRCYKSKLKICIKNSQNFNLSKFLKKINFFISKWRMENNYCTSFFISACMLDIYLYRLLWKWAKRKHPRRSNSWIYSNYWKSFGGVWKFFCIDSSNGKLVFLKSHTLLKTKRFYKLPRSFKVFNLENYQKLNFIWFNKSKLSFNSIYRALWNKQKGMCFNCFKSINYFHFNSSKIFKSSKVLKVPHNQFSQLVLLHDKCIL